jgi:hypothetical protein
MKTIKILLLLVVATFTLQAQTIIKNKRILNDSSYTSAEINILSYKGVDLFVSCNDTVNVVIHTGYKPTPATQWATITDTVVLNTTGGGQGIQLRGFGVNRIPSAKLLYVTLQFQSSGNKNDVDTSKVANVELTNE